MDPHMTLPLLHGRDGLALAIGMPGPTELIIIGAVILLIFGGRKLPELANAMGKSITQFKRGLKSDDELEEGSREDKDGP